MVAREVRAGILVSDYLQEEPRATFRAVTSVCFKEGRFSITGPINGDCKSPGLDDNIADQCVS